MNPSVFELVKEDLKEKILEEKLIHGLLEIRLSKESLYHFVLRLKDHFQFDLFLDVTAIDYLDKRPERFDVVYHLYSTTHLVRIRLKVSLSEEAPLVATLTTLYGSAHFMERECHEMYGIKFEGNNDLRPILLYGGFEGHPLRKDYPINREQPIVPYIK